MIIIRKESPHYRQCSLSIMDNIMDPAICFDEKGICNYYYEYKAAESSGIVTGRDAEKKLSALINQIKVKGKSRRYDCIIGVSGGLDSSYLALKAKEFGLRVLCVHIDNGWNSELAVKNIENIITRCGFDLFTYVIDWAEFRDIQLAYFKAGVIDIEAITDIAIRDSLHRVCTDHNIGFILDGGNIRTEQTLPLYWINKNPNNLYDIHRQFGKLKLNRYPAKFKDGKYIHSNGNYECIPLLNYLDYNKKETKQIITDQLDWKDYGGKHYESVFTRFYQGYILPQKFGVDKRKAHLSNLIFSGQLTKEEALEEMKKPGYPEEQLLTDKKFVLKKLGISEEAFAGYVKADPVPHDFYSNDPGSYQTNYVVARHYLGKIKRKIFSQI